jgi:2-phospho-L-lactate guanylyltransferase
MSSLVTQLAEPPDSAGAVLIPVKAFNLAKGRLEGALDAHERADLAQAMATRLVTMQRNSTVAICCDDAEVHQWALSLGASVIWCPQTDLNGAVQLGFATVRTAGYRTVVCAHSDLPLAESLDWLFGWPGVTIVPDRHRTGSNVMAIPTALDFRFSYGAGSFHRHVVEALRHRSGLRIIHDDRLGWDVDRPDDLDVDLPPSLTNLLESPSVLS